MYNQNDSTLDELAIEDEIAIEAPIDFDSVLVHNSSTKGHGSHHAQLGFKQGQ